MTESFPSAAEWAQHVSPDEPHDLEEIESQVLGRAQLRDALAQQTGAPVSPVAAASGLFWVLCLLGPLLGATALWDRSGAATLSYSFTDQVAFTIAGVGFALSCVALIKALLDWARSGRHRDGTWMALGSIAAALAVIALLFAYSRSGTVSGPLPASVYLLPVWAGLVVGLITVLAIAVVPASDPASEQQWRHRRRLLNARSLVSLHGVDDLPSAPTQLLLADRREALETLRSRNLLDPGYDVETLCRRPLGQLVVPPEVQDERP